MQYTQSDCVRIAKRENNTKRNYLVVNPLQGKHIPVSPSKSLELFESLADQVKEAYPGECILFIGFAETATAIGAGVALRVGGYYTQTTRECLEGAEYLYFSEEHSHATAQKLVKNRLEEIVGQIDRVVFVEDEVTTGKTILNIVTLLKAEYPSIRSYAAASILNGMNEEALKRYEQEQIGLLYLVKTDHDKFPEIADRYTDVTDRLSRNMVGEKASGKGNPKDEMDHGKPQTAQSDISGCIVTEGYLNTRKVVHTSQYEESVEYLCEEVARLLDLQNEQEILILGTEEFMYPGLAVGASLERKGKKVSFHATTRSPIAICGEEDYPLKVRYELESLYEEGRKTFIYNLKRYDRVVILTDAAGVCKCGLESLLGALKAAGNDAVTVIGWGTLQSLDL